MNTAETIVSQLLAIHFADNVTLKARITILRFQMFLIASKRTLLLLTNYSAPSVDYRSRLIIY